MKHFSTSGFFVLRTPLFPIQEFIELSEGVAFPGALAGNSDLEAAVIPDRKLIRARLREVVERAEVKEALWLASPEFCEALALWRSEPESAKERKLEHSLYRYVARMTSRPTPFGLFAGCSVGEIGPETRLELGARCNYSRRSRLDMEYLSTLADKISSDPALHGRLSFRPNTSLYFAGGRYHHAQSYLSEEARCYRLVATDHTPYLAATLERAQAGASPRALAEALVKSDPEIRLEEAEGYIRDLIDSQLLVSDLSPPVTGPEPMDDMLAQLDQFEDASLADALRSIAGSLHLLDEQGVGNDLAGYREILSTVSQLPAKFKPEHLVQVDMMKPAPEASLSRRLIDSIFRGVDALHSLTRIAREDPLQQFKKDFYERYQDQQVPLLLVLDDENGIGFESKDSQDAIPEPLIEKLDLSAAEDEQELRAGRREMILLRKLQEQAERKQTTLKLEASLLQSLKVKNPPPLPEAFAVMGQLLPESSGYDFYLQTAVGPSGALLLGRFCHADSRLNGFVQEHLRAEEQARAGEDVIFAEIAHLPEGRIGNVLYRPMLRDYEIPFLASSRAPVERQIPVADLLLSVENDRIVLRSKRLGREVLPRLTSAHNYQHGRSLKLYKFLCLLQTQGVSGLVCWNWRILEHSSFLPRVTFENLVLSPATWRISKELIEEFSRGSFTERLRRVHEWRTAKAIPRFALLVESDNQLLIDFDNVLSVETLIEYIRNRESERLVEMLPAPDQLCVHGPEGAFTHEVVIPFVDSRISQTEATPAQQAIVNDMKRSFLPGSAWLFVKIYASPSQIDRVLLEHLKPLIEKILAAGEADSWFFLRYGDPEWHLRLRFYGQPAVLTARVLPLLRECVERQDNQGKLWRMQVDTYEREVERYGGAAGMGIAEQLFQYDSELTLQFLAAIADQLGKKIRWHLALLSADALLTGLGFDLNGRRQLVNSLREGREKNFRPGDGYKKQLSEKFRAERQTLEMLLESSGECSEVPEAAQLALARFRGRMKTIREALYEAQQKGSLAKSITELAGSYLHMHLNRMFRSSANAQEMVLYDFLGRTYDSRLARERNPYR